MILTIANALLGFFLLLDIFAFMFITKEFIQLKLDPPIIIFSAGGLIILSITFIYFILGGLF